MTKKIIIVLSEWGYWGEELIGPLDACDRAGYEVTFVTPTGKKPTPLAVSMDTNFVDPPLGRPVVNEHYARRTREVYESTRIDYPKNLSEWFPIRPYPSDPEYLRKMEAYYRRLDEIVDKDLINYDAMVIVGGSGAMMDLANNQRLHEMILGFYRLNKPIAAECYGVTCLAFARDFREKKSIILGKHVTGHPTDYDYYDGTGFEGNHAIDGSRAGFGDGYINFGPPFYPLEHILRDAVGTEGEFIGRVGHEISSLVDYPFITSRSTPDSAECGRLLLEVLEHGLKRYGW